LTVFSAPAISAGANWGISEIWTKTADRQWASTNDEINIEICDRSGRCCSTNLNNPKGATPFQQGNTDKFNHWLLNDCRGATFWGSGVTATLSKNGTDGWYVDWTEIKFADGRSYMCSYDQWLDSGNGHSLTKTASCNQDGAIAEISTKTGGMRSADTDDAVSMTVCDASDNCCTTALDNPGFDDRKKGALNTYSDETVLGDCGSSSISNHLLRGQLTATLSKDGTDGWYVEWAQIKTFGGASFTCMFNVWMDDASGYSREATSDCTEDVGVTSITTKTGSSRSSGTDDSVTMSVCDGEGTCCSTTTLDNPGDDFKRGAANTFTNPKGLGECLTTAMTGPIRATLSKTGSDGWYVDWAQVQLARGVFHTCNFTSWLDDASGYSREITVECNENVGITEISTETGSMRSADTDDSVTITVCDVSGGCCSNPLNIPSYDDRAVGHVDTYNRPDVLGQCYRFVPARGDLTVTLEKTGSDGWNVQWTKVKLSGGRSFTCNFNIWLDNDNGHSNSETAQCQRDL